MGSELEWNIPQLNFSRGIHTGIHSYTRLINTNKQHNMKTNTRRATGFTLVELLVVIAIIVTLAGVATPVLLAQRKKADHAKAIQNAKQVGYALFNFESDEQQYPDENSESLFTGDDSDAVLSSAGGSNQLLSQLVAGGYVDQEAPFYCKTKWSREPDNNQTEGQLLKGKEVGFSYILDGGDGMSSSYNSAIPLLVAPVKKEGGDSDDGGEWDDDPYNGRSVVLRIDMSAVDPKITKGEIKLKSKLGLFETGNGSVWGDANPEIEHPNQNSGE